MKLITLNKAQLAEFALALEHSQFLQSPAWGDFLESLGNQVWRLGILNDQKQLVATAQIIKNDLPLNLSYLYCPRGPLISALAEKDKTEVVKLLLKEARDLAIQTKSDELFFRFEPTFDFKPFDKKIVKTETIQPSETLIINLAKTEADLSTELHPKTRYNLNLAQRKGIVITLMTEVDWEKIWPLFLKTSSRDGFRLHSKNYYQKMLIDTNLTRLWLAEYREQPIAASVIGYFGDTATYLHGASDYQFRNFMAAQLLHWQIMLEAKKQGYSYYDFHGITTSTDPKHPWAGLTRFKKGFGGQSVVYPGTFDFIYQPNWYKMYKIFRKLNRILKKA